MTPHETALEVLPLVEHDNPEGVLVLEPVGAGDELIVRYGNPAAHRLAALPAELRGRALSSLAAEAGTGPFAHCARAIARVAQAREVTVPFVLDGQEGLWRVLQLPFGQGMLVRIRDVSAEHREHADVERRLRASLREKELLLGEVQHRVKNNLQVICSLLSLQAAQVHDPQVLALFRDTQNRLRSIALFHGRFYGSGDVGRIAFGRYATDLATGLFHALGVSMEQIGLDVQVDDVRVGVDAAIPCGLIINELVSNSLRHAFPGGRRGHIRIRLRRLGDTVELSVSDDGIGMALPNTAEIPPTLGLELVFTLSEQLGGTATFDRGTGTSFRVVFGKTYRQEGLAA